MLHSIPTHFKFGEIHDGAPTHFSVVVRNHCHALYPGSWGWTCCLASTLPDLNLLDFFFWGHLESLVYEILVAAVKDLTARIVFASADIASIPDLSERIRQSFVRGCRMCCDLRNCNFEQFIRQSLVVAFLTSNCEALFVL
ncbi:uncharacterized protein TNCV_98071 [Trichonephila clavipes]|nr:uncharacterized protein TNCV_98071 [Trichonephila clavipes]